ncbi:MAG: N-acetylglucosamine kinase [Aggregatilineales bacterium]
MCASRDLYLGVDGGGSAVRVAVVDAALQVRGEAAGPAVNPSALGREEAARRIVAAVQAALASAGAAPEQVRAVGVGVAGANTAHAADWLRAVVAAAVPGAQAVLSSDYEIALVGGHGARRGLLLLAGTGSLAYGVSAAGETALAGAWGYLLGDEGSGYWLGAQGLRAVVRMDDGRGQPTALAPALLNALGLEPAQANGCLAEALIPWLYAAPRVSDVARLAPLVLACAAAGDAVARQLVAEAARELALAARAVRRRLGLDAAAPPVFAGSLLAADNLLRDEVCRLLGINAPAAPRYPPVIGAALLARDASGGRVSG